jgi:uncharacterized membrane protein YczE
MKNKKVFYCEVAYIIGIIILALGTALMVEADFGVSMIVAPAYLLHLKISPYLSFFSFGVAEYVFQAFILVVLSLILRKVKKIFFLSFATTFLYGIFLDIFINAVATIPLEGFVYQLILYILGTVVCAIGVAFLFHTYFPPEAYELFVKEISQNYNIEIGKVKTAYDVFSCVLAVVLSLCLFGGFVGISWGTFVCALVNGWLISMIGKFLENKFTFKDALPIRDKLNS